MDNDGRLLSFRTTSAALRLRRSNRFSSLMYCLSTHTTPRTVRKIEILIAGEIKILRGSTVTFIQGSG
jgi:hypothetical protein